MSITAQELAGFRQRVEAFHAFVQQVPERLTAVQLAPDKWSLREILGHLVDSASNNHQRFVRLQEGGPLQFPGYEAERWISIQRWNLFPWPVLVGLWRNYNELLLHLIAHFQPERLQALWQSPSGPRPLEFIARDYYRHLAEHEEHFRRRLEEVRARSENPTSGGMQ